MRRVASVANRRAVDAAAKTEGSLERRHQGIVIVGGGVAQLGLVLVVDHHRRNLAAAIRRVTAAKVGASLVPQYDNGARPILPGGGARNRVDREL